ncbi:MAG: transcriptional regulator with AAA-type ATPase domain [Bradymonadia bacterium]|jgi:transcriptional regulator with AAA-type ATPase domain
MRLKNPYQPANRRTLRALVSARMLPPARAELSAWSTWWRELPAVLSADRAAALALFVGVAEGYPFDAARGRIEAVSGWPEMDITAAAELVCRSLTVQTCLDRIIGVSAAIGAVRAAAWAAAFGDRLDHTLALGTLLQSTPVLILGETGSGKELVAQAICRAAPGRWRDGVHTGGPQEAVNLASLPVDLVFSALFGHRRGAYTGAQADRAGVLERCHGGAVFLDEVADLPMPAQVALLRTLQEGRVRPLGADEPVDAAPRIISATHRDLLGMAERGRFRLDLYHRLSSVVLHVPPLRAHAEDLPMLAESVLRQVDPELRPLVMERFDAFCAGQGAGYHWPGNVRELAAVVRTLALGLTPRLLAPAEPDGGDLPPGMRDGEWSLEVVKRWYVTQVAAQHSTRRSAADALGIDRSTLRILLKP